MISRSFLPSRNDKGYLDENEQKLRDMDTSNRGFLTNDKVYALLEEQVKLQKTLVTQRKLLVGLCAFAVILALANMGTAVSDDAKYCMLCHLVLCLVLCNQFRCLGRLNKNNKNL